MRKIGPMTGSFAKIAGLAAMLTAVGLIIAPCLAQSEPEGSLARGKELQQQLFTALDNASSVIVIEHGNRADNPFDKNYEPPTYAKVTLSVEQIRSLRHALPAAKDRSSDESLDCIFDDHHAIVIREKDGHVITLNLCFVCGELSLNRDGERIMPDGWPESLSKFIASLGLHPNGPWPLPHR